MYFTPSSATLKYLALIPLIFLLMLVPAYIAGRDAQSLLSIYAGQVTSSGVSGASQFNGGGTGRFNDRTPGQSNSGGPGRFNGGARGQFNGGGFTNRSSSSLTSNAPSFYQWLPANAVPDTFNIKN